MRMPWKQCLPIMALVGLLVLPAGCGKVEELGPAISAFEINPFANYTSTVLKTLVPPTAQVSSALGATQTLSNAAYLKFFDQLVQGVRGLQSSVRYNLVKTYKITYTVDGKSLTGLVAVPYDLASLNKLKVPMISLQHPTQVLRSQSPSRVSVYADEELTVPFGTMLAAKGYIVVMPDYPGMGDNYDVHPYCMTDLAKSVAGLITEAGKTNQPWSTFTSWNGRLFLLGFSEGGYATLVTANEIQQHPLNYPGINLVGVAALDGPYDLSGTMRNLMLTANKDFSAPYFLPYVVAGYAAYGTVDSSMLFNNAVLGSSTPGVIDFNVQLNAMLNGAYTSDEISNMMKNQPAYPTDGPKSILTYAYKAALGNYTSSLYAKLQVNNAYNGWTPQSPTKFLVYHNTKDDLVPFGNYSAAHNAWRVQSATFMNFTAVTNPSPLLGSVHATSLIPAYIVAAKWIRSLGYP